MTSQIEVDYHIQRLAAIAITTDDRVLAQELVSELHRERVKALHPDTIEALTEMMRAHGLTGDE